MIATVMALGIASTQGDDFKEMCRAIAEVHGHVLEQSPPEMDTAVEMDVGDPAVIMEGRLEIAVLPTGNDWAKGYFEYSASNHTIVQFTDASKNTEIVRWVLSKQSRFFDPRTLSPRRMLSRKFRFDVYVTETAEPLIRFNAENESAKQDWVEAFTASKVAQVAQDQQSSLNNRVPSEGASSSGTDSSAEQEGNDQQHCDTCHKLPSGGSTASAGGGIQPPPGAGDDVCNTAAKFSSGRTMRIGRAGDAARGIWSALGVEFGGTHCIAIQSDGVNEIKREFTTLGQHCSEKDKSRFEYIFEQLAALLEQNNGVKRDIGNEGMTLQDFVDHPTACHAKLSTAHVLALRLYTSNSYGRINEPLRDGCTSDKPHPYAATTYFIHDGIMKLRTIREGDATLEHTFWRGMDDMGVTGEFLKQGGTEMACMSTTEDFNVARTKFAKAGEAANPLLIKVQSTNLMDCGANIKFLSMYPEEEEVLFPPLTYLLPIGEPVVEDGCTIITVQPRF
jgi:hypothetical protein